MLNKNLVLVPTGTSADGAKIYASNFWALLTDVCTVPGMVTGEKKTP
jgi:hypothetical protein